MKCVSLTGLGLAGVAGGGSDGVVMGSTKKLGVTAPTNH